MGVNPQRRFFSRRRCNGARPEPVAVRDEGSTAGQYACPIPTRRWGSIELFYDWERSAEEEEYKLTMALRKTRIGAFDPTPL